MFALLGEQRGMGKGPRLQCSRRVNTGGPSYVPAPPPTGVRWEGPPSPVRVEVLRVADATTMPRSSGASEAGQKQGAEGFGDVAVDRAGRRRRLPGLLGRQAARLHGLEEQHVDASGAAPPSEEAAGLAARQAHDPPPTLTPRLRQNRQPDSSLTEPGRGSRGTPSTAW